MTNIDLKPVLVAALSPTHIALLALLGFCAYSIIVFIRTPYAENLRNLRGPGLKHWFLGSWPKEAEINGLYEHYLLETIRDHGPVCTYTEMGREPVIMLGDHRAACKALLQTPYQRVPILNQIIRRHAGAGLLTMEGEQHRRQRKVAHPAFTQASVYDMAPVMHEKATKFVSRLNRAIEADNGLERTTYGTALDISKDLVSAALDIIGAVGFNYQFDTLSGNGTTSALEKAFHDCLHLLTTGTAYSAMRIVLGAPVESFGRLFRIEEQLHLDRSTKLVREISSELVERAKDVESSATDLLTLMVRANSAEDVKPSQRLADEEIREMVPVVLFAGHETTATALSWSMLALVEGDYGHTVQARLRAELAEVGEETWASDPRTLDSLPYLDAFTRETMRFYCPVRNLPRQAPFDDVIPLARPVKLRDGTMTREIRVRKGQKVVFPISWMNRDESLWGPDGNVFKAERWLPDDHEYKDSGADLELDPSVKELRGVWSNLASFGAVAILEFKVIIAALVTNFEILPPNLPGEPALEFSSLDMIVSKPVLKGRPEQGLTMPVRIKKLASTTLS
ncbi:hypothetical protein OC835_000795 [Tilletia horrida]|nr:hypothetical protein OC835_000795 [Tilletia horrida]